MAGRLTSMDWVWIVVGLATLIGAAELLVRGSVWCALAMGVRPMLVGLTLVAFGTSAPELFVGLASAFDGKPGFATGSALGSNIANIGVIVGLAAMLKPIEHTAHSARFEVRFLLLSCVAIFVPLLLDQPIGPVFGSFLLAALLAFTAILVTREKRHKRKAEAAGHELPAKVDPTLAGGLLHVAFVLVGLTGLKFGGDWLVEGASGVARSLGMSETLIGMTILAVGTSLPELAASAVAARKGHPEIALGNVLGSNVFNICMVLGGTSLIAPLPMNWLEEGTAAAVGLALAIVLALLLRFRHGIGRIAGFGLLVAYAGYVVAAVLTSPGGG